MTEPLSWYAIEDFTAGLWEKDALLEVPGGTKPGFLQMEGAYPLASGGIRATPKWRVENGPFLTDLQIIGFEIYRAPEGGAAGPNGAVAAVPDPEHASPNSLIIYTGGGPTQLPITASWVSKKTFVGNTAVALIAPVRFTLHTAAPVSGGDGLLHTRVYFNVNEQASAGDNGVWRIGSFNGVPDLATNVFDDKQVKFITSHQDRLVAVVQDGPFVGASTFTSQYNRIRFSEPRLDAETDAAWPTSNYIALPARHLTGEIAFVEPSFPNELYPALRAEGFIIVAGELDEPTIREATQQLVPQLDSWPARTPQGLAYLTVGHGVVSWQGEGTVAQLSPSIDGSPMNSALHTSRGWLGEVGYGAHWMFTPKGYIHDFRTGAWFKRLSTSVAALAQNDTPFYSYDAVADRMYAAGGRTIMSVSLDEDNSERDFTWRIQLPHPRMDGRKVTVREIELHLEVFGDSEVKVHAAAVDQFTDHVATCLFTDGPRHIVTVPLSETGEFTTLIISAVRGSFDAPVDAEAPMLKKLRIGYIPGPHPKRRCEHTEPVGTNVLCLGDTDSGIATPHPELGAATLVDTRIAITSLDWHALAVNQQVWGSARVVPDVQAHDMLVSGTDFITGRTAVPAGSVFVATTPTVTDGEPVLLRYVEDFGTDDFSVYSKPTTEATVIADMRSDAGWTLLNGGAAGGLVTLPDFTGMTLGIAASGDAVLTGWGPGFVWGFLMKTDLAVVADADFTTATIGAPSFIDEQGNAWSIVGDGTFISQDDEATGCASGDS